MTRQLLENLKLQGKLDWFHFETQIRKEVGELMIPFRDELKDTLVR